MTDDDYVAELRSHGMLSTNKAADRIEALTAERDRLKAFVVSQGAQMQRQSEAAEVERDRLREALRGLERASTEVASCGARTGPHWLKLTVANLSARAALKGETP